MSNSRRAQREKGDHKSCKNRSSGKRWVENFQQTKEWRNNWLFVMKLMLAVSEMSIETLRRHLALAFRE
jgi:hypothetical protein